MSPISSDQSTFSLNHLIQLGSYRCQLFMFVIVPICICSTFIWTNKQINLNVFSFTFKVLQFFCSDPSLTNCKAEFGQSNSCLVKLIYESRRQNIFGRFETIIILYSKGAPKGVPNVRKLNLKSIVRTDKGV